MSLNRIKIPTIYFGKNSLKQLRNFKQKKVFVVTDNIIDDLYGDKIRKALKGKEFMFFTDVLPDPLDGIIIKGGNLARSFGPDLIIGIGGGSVMDSAKGIYFLYERTDKSLYDMNPINYFKLGRKSKLILIPTTSGTGAEHTGAIIVTNSKTGQKMGLICFELVPSAIILDPKLPLGMPPKLTASTGVDALVHAIESFMNKMNNDIIESFSLQAIKTIMEYLPLAVRDYSNILEVREKLHYAASMAGIALANSAAGLAHSCGHALGSVFHLQHGIAVGLMLPYIIQFNKNECLDKYKRILNLLKINYDDSPAQLLSDRIQKFLGEIELPISLKELDISENDFNKNFDRLVDFAYNDLATSLNPRCPSIDDIKRIFRCAYDNVQINF